MTTCKQEDPFIGLSHCYVCSRKYAASLEKSIMALQEQVKALTEERDETLFILRDLIEGCQRHELRIKAIIDKHGGWDESLGTYLWHIERIIDGLTAERDAQAEAVRVLAEEVNAAWKWNDADMYDRPDTWDNATSDAVRANPIARAAVEGKPQ